MIKLIYLLSLIFMISCSSNTSIDTQTVNIYPKESEKSYDFNQDFITKEIISLDSNNNSLLGNPLILDYNEQYITLCDKQKLTIFNKSIAKNQLTIDAVGRSNQEYLNISDAYVDYDKEIIAILCYNSNKVVNFNLEGKFINTIKIDSISSMTLYDNKIYTYKNPYLQDSYYDIVLYSSDWKHISGVESNNQTQNNKSQDIYTSYSFNIYNNTPTIFIENSFCSVENGKLSPYLFLDKGKYDIPMDVMSDIKRKNERMNYIWGDYGQIVGDYLFYKYYFDNKIYFDIYSIGQNKLVYRRTASSRQDNMGFPVTINGKSIYVWPDFIKGNSILYVLTDNQLDALNIKNRNVSILEIQIK